MLPKFHKKLGLEVEILASLVSFDKNGKPCLLNEATEYVNEYGIPVKRLNYKKGYLNKILRRYNNTFGAIIESNPDIIFIHGVQFLDIKYIKRYLVMNPKVKVYVDNHADYNNSGKNIFSKYILHKIFWRWCANIIGPYTLKFYGVLPARVDFLVDVYKIPRDKVELLVMGVDDEKVKEVKNIKNADRLKKELNIDSGEFIIVTGGKIDFNKAEILNLMEAVNKLDDLNVKLIVFGSVIPELKEEFNSKLTEKIKYVGWVNSEDVYEYFNIANLVAFPGLHSVFWEQAVGFGKPCVFKYIKGFTHVDIGGNCEFFHGESTGEILKVINNIVMDNNKYQKLLLNAENKGMLEFSYEKIASKSLKLGDM